MPQRGFFVDENVASLTLESAALDALGVSEPVVLSAGTLVVSPFARLCASAAVENVSLVSGPRVRFTCGIAQYRRFPNNAP